MQVDLSKLKKLEDLKKDHSNLIAHVTTKQLNDDQRPMVAVNEIFRDFFEKAGFTVTSTGKTAVATYGSVQITSTIEPNSRKIELRIPERFSELEVYNVKIGQAENRSVLTDSAPLESSSISAEIQHYEARNEQLRALLVSVENPCFWYQVVSAGNGYSNTSPLPSDLSGRRFETFTELLSALFRVA